MANSSHFCTNFKQRERNLNDQQRGHIFSTCFAFLWWLPIFRYVKIPTHCNVKLPSHFLLCFFLHILQQDVTFRNSFICWGKIKAVILTTWFTIELEDACFWPPRCYSTISRLNKAVMFSKPSKPEWETQKIRVLGKAGKKWLSLNQKEEQLKLFRCIFNKSLKRLLIINKVD